MLDEYRQRFATFHTLCERERFLFYVGLKDQRETSALFRDHSDLFTSARLSELETCYEAISAYRKTERSAIQRLHWFATLGNLTLKSLEVADAIDEFEARPAITWGSQKLTISQAQRQIKSIPIAASRHELQARCNDELQAAQDLWKERFTKSLTGAQSLGFADLQQLEQKFSLIDFETLAVQTAQLLAQTESQFAAKLKPRLTQEAQISAEQATSADLSFWQNIPRGAAFFLDYRWRDVYSELFANLGFKVSQQNHVEIDALPRSGKTLKPFCAAVQVPAEIKLCLHPIGASNSQHLFYQQLLGAAGQTQLFAWTSRELPYQFRVPGDFAIGFAWGELFCQLLRENEFLIGTFSFPESTQFRSALAFARLLKVRRAAALAQYEIELWAGKLGTTPGARFTELLTEATQVRHDDSEQFRAVKQPFQACAQLRAWAFEAQFREHLKTKFGGRWWLSRKAGEMLIDLWNTGHRYSIEELAALIGLGPLDFEWLGRELVEAL